AHGVVLLAADAAGGLDVGAPAVDAAHAADGAHDGQDGAAGAGQLVAVGGALQLLGGVGQGREGEGGVVRHADGERRGGAAGGVLLLQGEGAGVHVDAAVLGHQVGGDVGLLGPAAEPGARVPVGVGRARKAGPADPGGGV